MNLLHKKQSNVPRRRLAVNDVRSSNPSDIFKRNRTFTGTTSNSLDSLNIVKSGLESPRAHAHNLTTKRRKVFSIFVIIILSAVFLWILISHFTASVVISTPSTDISKSINNDKYEQIIQDYFELNPLSRFQFFLDQDALSSYVASKLSEVESVKSMDMAGIGITNISIKMRIPIAGWKINNKQYYVDAKGVPFEQNYYTNPAVQIVDNSGATLQAGAASVSKRFLSFVGLIVSLSKTSGYTVTQAILPANTTRELEIKLKESTSLIKLSIDRPAGEQIEDMSRAVKYFTVQGRAPNYIDVRVSGKAFFK